MSRRTVSFQSRMSTDLLFCFLRCIFGFAIQSSLVVSETEYHSTRLLRLQHHLLWFLCCFFISVLHLLIMSHLLNILLWHHQLWWYHHKQRRSPSATLLANNLLWYSFSWKWSLVQLLASIIFFLMNLLDDDPFLFYWFSRCQENGL